MIMTTYTYEAGVERVLEALTEDYAAWAERAGITLPHPTYQIVPGRSYDKILKVEERGQTSAVGFIVKKTTKKFLKGAILMAASYNAPATNFERGHVYCEEKIKNCVRWCGIV